jgi:two-component system, OmpR family, KDP operon response regulator KdpE
VSADHRTAEHHAIESRSSEHRRILVVDDEPQITRVLRTSLDAHGYDLRVANDGETALQIARDWPPDLMITDLSMPLMDGLDLCRRFRAKSNAPIIVLSVKGEERTKVQALDAGADDYVTKPFGINELLARVRANLRRAPHEETVGGVIEDGDFRIDLDAHLSLVRGRELRLTPKEFDLLVYLARNPRKVVTHRKLLSAVWGADSAEQPEYLRVFIGQLRRKLEADKEPVSYILTEPWVGYRFEPGGVRPE